MSQSSDPMLRRHVDDVGNSAPARYSRIHPSQQTPLDEKARPLLSKEEEKWLHQARALRARDREIFLRYCNNVPYSDPAMIRDRWPGEEEEDDDDDDIFYLVPFDKAPFPPYRLSLPYMVPSGHDACGATNIFLCQPAHMCPDAGIRVTTVAHGRQFEFINLRHVEHLCQPAQGGQAVGDGRPGGQDGSVAAPHPPSSELSIGNKLRNSGGQMATDAQAGDRQPPLDDDDDVQLSSSVPFAGSKQQGHRELMATEAPACHDQTPQNDDRTTQHHVDSSEERTGGHVRPSSDERAIEDESICSQGHAGSEDLSGHAQMASTRAPNTPAARLDTSAENKTLRFLETACLHSTTGDVSAEDSVPQGSDKALSASPRGLRSESMGRAREKKKMSCLSDTEQRPEKRHKGAQQV